MHFFGQMSQETIGERLGKKVLCTSHHPEGNEISMRIVQQELWFERKNNLSLKAQKISSLLKFCTLSENRLKEESNSFMTA